MASYQVPQFLDSGDKILGPLNLRQFGYALGGFLFSVVIYTVSSRFFPALGAYNYVPAAPVAIISAYLALGKYNGRDSDIYLYKLVLHFLKPKILRYKRMTYYNDINEKANKWTESAIANRWKNQIINKNEKLTYIESFRKSSELEKAKKLKEIGQLTDINVVNTLTEIERKNLEKQKIISELNRTRK